MVHEYTYLFYPLHLVDPIDPGIFLCAFLKKKNVVLILYNALLNFVPPASGPSFELHITMMLLIKYFRILITGYWEDLINFPLSSPSPWRNKFEFHIPKVLLSLVQQI